MRKKNIICMAVSAFLLTAVIVGSPFSFFSGNAIAAEKMRFVLETAFPESSMQAWVKTGKPWTEAITRRTDGRVQFQVHFGDMASLKDLVKSLGGNLVQFGAPFVGYFPSQFPMQATLGTLNYPAFTKGDPERVAITRILYSEIPAFRDAYTQNNIKKLFILATPNLGLVSRSPVAGIDDLKGLKIRTFGKYMSLTLRAADVVPVSMSYTDMLDAISKRVVDGTLVNFTKALDDNLHEIAPNIINLGSENMPAHVIPYSYAVNMDVWKKLPKDIKRIMLEEGKKTEMEYAFWQVNAQRDAAEEMRKRGAKIHTIPQEDMEEWSRRCGDLGTEAAKELDGLGLPGTQALNMIRRLADLSMDELMVEFDKAWEKEFALIE